LHLAAWSLRWAEGTVIACSESVASAWGRRFRLPRVHVIPNGTTDAGFRQPGSPSGHEWRIGIIGRIAPEKGQADFLRAAALLAAESSNMRFVVCGAPMLAPESYMSEVRALAAGLPVDFLGWRQDAISVLKNLNLLVIPSKSEGLPRVLLEAFSAGVPVVAFPAGGVAEAIEDKVTGFLVREASPAALATCLHDLIGGSPERLREVAANAREAWQRSYTVEAYRARIIGLMETLAAPRLAEPETTHRPRSR
jgi:glycosyltransferase involved in cell wall biosynthesis